ncbi:nitroreductase family deazaflavin-dependent oxidoreductase [Cellulomonas sp. HD19AZ1]|uniref:nitroreductase family deazaflavin-dependent oxidoreductase n=1 Tax=Cellulomonas sp. HD19AZ1 TaxID=2559593 RepID=UPI00107076BB|nr:nitroreductase family deazaflavin-dependent oxidoreductase [Cellulomonas sp. HD19AZ1]TFH70611.1 nitroreductase family deazaflavin-dependent oxidoreductase [Cellulomonas sp. HD19AZ1]
MPLARGIIRLNKRFTNPVMLRLAGIGSIVDLEHVGRKTGTVRHTPLIAFRRGGVVTIALTYGSDVQWLANVRHAGGCRMRMGREILSLGAPRVLEPADAMTRIPQPQRALLRWPIRCRDYVELPVLRPPAPEGVDTRGR